MRTKSIVLIAFVIGCIIECSAQKKDEYKASNGITYKIGDKIKLGQGSGLNGSFVYLTVSGWAALADPNEAKAGSIPARYSGMAIVIKKIKAMKLKGVEKVMFSVGAGNISNYSLDIEGAIASCEIEDCKKPNQQTSDKYDRLKKLKELLDSGAITQAEYDKEKEKILSEN
jgi:hypothetical protein